MARKRWLRVRGWFLVKAWSVRNWVHGYAFGPVQRCRACTHTTPYHYPACSAKED